MTATNIATGDKKTVTAKDDGSYSIDGLAAGTYTLEAMGNGFAVNSKAGITLADGQTQQVTLTLQVSAVVQEVTVNSGIDSPAVQSAPSGGFVEERSAQSLVSNKYIENFTSPMADFGELVQIVPGAFTTSSNGIGLGQSKTYFRGFPDGDYDIDFDGIPVYDTNSPTHHSWAFFPVQWIGGVDFDRSPGSASTIWPYALRRIDPLSVETADQRARHSWRRFVRHLEQQDLRRRIQLRSLRNVWQRA